MDKEAPCVPDQLGLGDYSEVLTQGTSLVCRRQATLLLDSAGRLSGIITRGDVVRALRQNGAEQMSVGDAGSKDLVVTYPEEPLHAALTKMLSRDIGRLPVVDPADQRRVVGYLGRAAILSARVRLHHEENIRQKG
jgi:CBS domain-containing protein